MYEYTICNVKQLVVNECYILMAVSNNVQFAVHSECTS